MTADDIATIMFEMKRAEPFTGVHYEKGRYSFRLADGSYTRKYKPTDEVEEWSASGD